MEDFGTAVFYYREPGGKALVMQSVDKKLFLLGWTLWQVECQLIEWSAIKWSGNTKVMVSTVGVKRSPSRLLCEAFPQFREFASISTFALLFENDVPND